MERWKWKVRGLPGKGTPSAPGRKFVYPNALLVYMRHISAGDVVDADPPPDSIVISPEEFVRYVVRHIDDAL